MEMILQMLLEVCGCSMENHDSSFRKPPTQINNTGQRFYLLALSNILTLYWQGRIGALKETAHVSLLIRLLSRKNRELPNKRLWVLLSLSLRNNLQE